MAYIKINADQTTVYPYPLYQLREDFPNTSFPQPYERADLSSYGVFPVEPTAEPTYNPITHILTEGAPVQVADVWTQQWVLTARSAGDAATELNKARRERWREVKAIRDDKIKNGGVFLVDKWYSVSVENKILILWVLALGSGVNTSQRIEMMDGSMSNLNFNRATDLLSAAATQSAAITAYADSLKALIDASPDPFAVDINAGWPAVYTA